MTRTEALRRLHGTWRFETRLGRVAIRDVGLCTAVDEVRAGATAAGTEARPQATSSVGRPRSKHAEAVVF